MSAAAAARRLESAAHAIKADAGAIVRCVEVGAWDRAERTAARVGRMVKDIERALSDLANALKQEEQARD